MVVPNGPSDSRSNGKGKWALICGIVGFIPVPILGFWIPVVAIVLGVQGKRLAKQGLATNHGAAQAGFVLGIIGLAFHGLLALSYAFN